MAILSEEEYGSYDDPELRASRIIAAVMSGKIKTHTENCTCPQGQVGCTGEAPPVFRHGDPRKTRMKVLKHGTRWRVFELAQYGQVISRHGNPDFLRHETAMQWAFSTAARDRMLGEKYGPDRGIWKEL